MPTEISSYGEMKPGDYYEDCAFHPCLCVRVNEAADEVLGISLVDGTYPRACSIKHCRVRGLTLQEALHWRFFGPADERLPENTRW